MTTTRTNPYADAADAYWQAGWRGILPLPPRAKKHPPTGYTGHDGKDPSYPDIATWADDGERNICLRLPDGIIGIDVDAYNGKPGAATLAALTDAHGPLPPTWLSTSRDDGISGIRIYRVPPGLAWPSVAGPGIETVRREHRYMVVHPSIHPEGGTYRWIDERNPAAAAAIPDPHNIPHLPDRWIAGLTGGNLAADHRPKTSIDDARATAVLAAMPAGEPCHHIKAAAGNATTGGDRHDTYNHAVLAVVSAGHRGCPGALAVLGRLRAAFTAETTADRSRTPAEAEAEWRRSLHGAIAIVADEPGGTGCPDTHLDWIDLPADTATTEPDDDDETANAYRAAVARRAAELRINDDAKALNATRHAAEAPPLQPVRLDDFLAQPDDPVRYRVDGLALMDARTLIVAAAKSGKTTLGVGNLLPCLVDGGDFLGRFTTIPTDGTVAYLNLEVSEATMRAWMRRAGIRDTSKVVVYNLRGRTGSLNLATPAGRKRLAAQFRDDGATTAMLDPLAPVLAAHGLVEDSNSDVATFFAWWAETLADAGINDDYIFHHAGHAGQRSRGASRLLDEPDAIWTITRANARPDDDDMLGPDDRRYLTAYGRDIDLPESGLDYDPATGRLTINDTPAGQLRQRSKETRVEDEVLRRVAEKDGMSQRAIIDMGGNADQIKSAIARLVAAGRLDRADLGAGRGFAFHLPAGRAEGAA